jgi:hypothetical protein
VNPLAQTPPRVPGFELRKATRLIDSNGSVRTVTLPADTQTAMWCEAVLTGQRGLIEVVRATRDADGQLRMRSRRDPAGYLEAEHGAAGVVALAAKARGRGEEVFACPVPKDAPEPGRCSAARGRVVWVDIDGVCDRDAVESLAELRPHLICHSGGGLHAYWRLGEAVEPDRLEALNRRLCVLAGGDRACFDRGRIMRLAGSYNGRRQRWCRLLMVDRSRPAVDPARLAERVEDPDPPPPPPTERPSRRRDDPLEAIAPPDYFRALCGVHVEPTGGDIRCPLPGHEDQYASCHVYAEPGRGFWCFGCRRGGGATDLVSLLDWGPCGRELRGAAFAKAHAEALRRLA